VSSAAERPAPADRPSASNGHVPDSPRRLSPGELQQARILAAMRAIIDAQGVGAASVSRIIRRASVPRGAFYAQFDGREDALVTLVQGAIQHSRATVLAASEQEAGWQRKTRAGLEALLALYQSEPDIGRLCLIHSRDPAAGMQRLRATVLDQLAAHIAAGEKGRARPGSLSAECTVAGVLGVLEARLRNQRTPQLTALAGELASFIVMPYRGVSAANAERARASSAIAHDRELAHANGRRPIRTTYRTMRVLAAVGARPGLGNLEIAALAGISDQGQISKLLRRLSAAGLIENTGPGQRQAAAKAWCLTREGKAIERSLLDPLPRRA
jgi:AcrR family transcriptional regulator